MENNRNEKDSRRFAAATARQEALYHLTSDAPGDLDSYLDRRPEERAAIAALRLRHDAILPLLAVWGATRSAPQVPRSETPDEVAFTGTLRIPGFEILGELGRGGKGTVYRARELDTERIVALKVVPRLGGGEMGRFLREIRAVARVESPHIVRLYRSGAGKEYLYFAMELLDGETLADVISAWSQEPSPARYRRAAAIVAKRGLASRHKLGGFRQGLLQYIVGVESAPELLSQPPANENLGLVAMLGKQAAQLGAACRFHWQGLAPVFGPLWRGHESPSPESAGRSGGGSWSKKL